jgi:hypothetical protein
MLFKIPGEAFMRRSVLELLVIINNVKTLEYDVVCRPKE